MDRGLNLPGLGKLRARAALSQAELAERAGVNYTTVSAVEGGRRRARYLTARKLAEALGVEVQDLSEL